jgi:hypothetical protein
LQTNLDNPPTCDVDLNTINTPAQARAARTIPLACRTHGARGWFWQYLFNNDVYASFFKDACDIVDLRRMIKDTARSDAWFDVFAQSCDTFHRRVVVFEDAKTDLHILMNSAILRYSANFDDPSRSTLAFKIIRGVFKDLGYDKPQNGGIKWQDIPILGEALRGSRRGSAAMASDTRLTSADRVRAPNRSTLG